MKGAQELGPLRVQTAASRAVLDGVHPDAVSPTWPAFGEVREADGRRLREVTFAVAAPAGKEGMVHINGVTDSSRADITQFLLDPAPFGLDSGEVFLVGGFLLPDDLVASYRFAVAPSLARDAGATREGWLAIHALGRPDPRNALELPNPLGDRSSVLVGPGASLHPVWSAASPVVREFDSVTLPSDCEHAVTLLTPALSEPVEELLVLFDGERWADVGIQDALARHDAPPRAVALVPSGPFERRAGLLPHPERIAAHLEDDVLPAAEHALGRRLPTVVAGQSYGGLAAASVAVLRPDLAARAIVQSGSFHFRAGEPQKPPADRVGDLLSHTPGLESSARLVVQVGSEEGWMVDHAARFSAAASAAGAAVTSRTYSGGHDYAWWRTGLFDGLDELG